MKLKNENTGNFPTVGIPRGMAFHSYGELWKNYFNALGVPIEISTPTTRETLEKGSDIASDETCLAMKIYLGHVASLIGKCDYILIPRLSNFGRRREQCPHFEGIHDVARNAFRSSGQKFLVYEVDETHGQPEQEAFLKLGQELGFSAKAAKAAFLSAKKQNQQAWNRRVQLEDAIKKQPGLKVFVAAHSYVLEDAYIGKPIREFLQKNDIKMYSGYIADQEQALNRSNVFSTTCKWETNRILLGNLALRQKDIDGVILISTFPCGSDAMVNDLVLRKLKGIPVLNLVLDSQTGMAGIETRLESFTDIIRFKKGLM